MTNALIATTILISIQKPQRVKLYPPLSIGDRYTQDVHFDMGLKCISCHADISEIPHEDDTEPVECAVCHDEVEAEFRTSYHGYIQDRNNPNAPNCISCHGKHPVLPSTHEDSPVNAFNQPQTCGICHGNFELKLDPEIRSARTVQIYLGSIHGKNLINGLEAAASCNDCHGIHDLTGAADTASPVNRRNIPETCSQCHGDVYYSYINSIHGKALKAGIMDSPVCTDCHGEHSIMSTIDPESPTFNMALSEQICADCHENPSIIQKYGLPGETLKTYQESYHGMANAKGSEEAATCVSCHGSHLILPQTNPNSTIHVDNVGETCSSCHPNADLKFATSYSHTALREEENGLNTFVRNMYLLLIALTVGGMLIHNTTIMSKYIRAKYYAGEYTDKVKRFDKHTIVQHILLTVSFTLLVVTGFALKFPDTWWIKFLTIIGLSEDVRGILHRTAAVIMVLTSMYHINYLFFTIKGRKELKFLMLRGQDLKDIKTNLLYHMGKSNRKPEYDKYDYTEKIEYWALIWGSVIMVVTGFILWFPTFFVQFLPSWTITLSETVHYYEAWLATLAIVVWHFFFVIFHPDEYPMSMTWLTGRMSDKEAQHKHSIWYKKMKKK